MASNDKKENEFLPWNFIYLIDVQLSEFLHNIDFFSCQVMIIKEGVSLLP